MMALLWFSLLIAMFSLVVLGLKDLVDYWVPPYEDEDDTDPYWDDLNDV